MPCFLQGSYHVARGGELGGRGRGRQPEAHGASERAFTSGAAVVTLWAAVVLEQPFRVITYSTRLPQGWQTTALSSRLDV